MQTETLRMKSKLNKYLTEVAATATAPSKFPIYIQQQPDGGEKMYEWRSRSNVARAVHSAAWAHFISHA